MSPSGSPERTDYTDPALERNQTAPMQEGVVEITCDNGKVYSTICVDGTAMVFERTLKSRFHNALWKGSFDIKEVGADCDWSPRIFNNQLCWTLPPAQYEARSTIQPDEGGLGLRRSSVPSSAYLMSDMRTAFSGMRAGSSAGSFRTAPQSMASGLRRRSEVAESGGGPRSGVSKRPRPTSRGGQRDTGADSAMSLGGRENNVPAVGVATRGANQTAAQGVGTSGGGVADMEVEKQAEGSVGVARQATGLGADPLGRGVGDMEVEEAAEAAPLAAPAPGSIEESVCSGTMRRHNPIRLLFEEYRAAGKEIPVVEYVPLPMDGNAIYIRPRGSGLSDSLNAGKYWGGCQTTNMALRNNETVRSWECSGGRKCVNEKCWYVKRTGKCCTEGFVRAGDGAMECMFCGHPSLNTGPCPAKRYEIQGEREVAHVHVGTHNHDVGQRIDQELMDKFHEAAMEAAAADPKLTAARFIQLSIREKLMERIRSGGEDVPDFAR